MTLHNNTHTIYLWMQDRFAIVSKAQSHRRHGCRLRRKSLLLPVQPGMLLQDLLLAHTPRLRGCCPGALL